MSIASAVDQRKKAKKQEQLLKEQAEERAQQLADQASQELNARAKEIRKATASARASASGAGINLASGSFLAQLQSFDQQLDEAQGLQSKNLNNAIKANGTSLDVAISSVVKPSGLEIAAGALNAGASAYSSAGGSFAQRPPNAT
ncbi:hypothetical protein [Stenotrophomonas oahuensis]|uniref:Uncharacterized protein n=1 Tax=Stenotrophomonas oahuensis TaxID=3003271 RepID=A0ABY9YNY4_9GAMM|nr:hypothetical protein [Stenotrophomonas sp. A5586]WNH52428.1 hypothetical protein PDM29_19230 [Stenotrophomonas sp. A5586]